MKHILAKLHLKNRAQAAVFAIRSGLADDENSEGAPT
jgi:DNA-binding CsgD family transcriptional regulator